MSKDVQDRMMFDAQSATLFSFLIQKVGSEKTKSIVRANLAGKESTQVIATTDMLGTDWDKIEKDWQTWVKEQKSAGPDVMRMQMTPGRAPDRP